MELLTCMSPNSNTTTSTLAAVDVQVLAFLSIYVLSLLFMKPVMEYSVHSLPLY